MFWVQLIFWIAFFVLFYCYIGYLLLLWLITTFKSRPASTNINEYTLPEVTFVVTAYNEVNFIEQKISNTLQLQYPSSRLHFLFVTDGSDDGTHEIVKEYPAITLLHQPQRQGKPAAINRAMQLVTTPYVVFSDANTLLNPDAIILLMKHYHDIKVGAVSGEKKIQVSGMNKAGIGEGIYWKYESVLKQLESKFYTLIGSAGELFSMRSSLFKPLLTAIVLDDFFMAVSVNEQGYRVVYEPGAVATETPSVSLSEERKRKVRIAAGAIQLMFTVKGLFNFFKHPLFSFQFISHKYLRWIKAPVCLVIIFIAGFFLRNEYCVYEVLFYLQCIFYVMAFIGWIAYRFQQFIPLFYFPFYFLFMNYCNVLGWIRYFTVKQTVLWEKADRVIN